MKNFIRKIFIIRKGSFLFLFFFLLKRRQFLSTTQKSLFFFENFYFTTILIFLIFNKYKFAITILFSRNLHPQEKDSFASLQRCIREKAISTSRLTFILLEITVEILQKKKKNSKARFMLENFQRSFATIQYTKTSSV